MRLRYLKIRAFLFMYHQSFLKFSVKTFTLRRMGRNVMVCIENFTFFVRKIQSYHTPKNKKYALLGKYYSFQMPTK